MIGTACVIWKCIGEHEYNTYTYDECVAEIANKHVMYIVERYVNAYDVCYD